MIKVGKPLSREGSDGVIELSRFGRGTSRISASSMKDALYGLGQFHIEDRRIQMVLMRLASRGQLSQYLSPRPGILEADIYIRQLLLFPDLEAQMKRINKRTLACLEAYVAGINDFLNERGSGWELKLSGIEVAPWTVRDVLALTKAISGMTLFDFQGKMEKFIVKLVQRGVDSESLKELFPGIKEKIDLELLKNIKLPPEPRGHALEWLSGITGFRGGSNFVVSGTHSSSEKPILAGDLLGTVSSLPSTWYDTVLEIPGNRISGFTIPGIPAILMGRSDYISYSPAFSYGNMVDYRIEECSGGKFRRGRQWLPFDVHRESIELKQGESEVVEIYENEHGILEGAPFEDGFYLVRSWSAQRGCGAADLDAALKLMEAKTVREAMRICRHIEVMPLSFLIADISGNIGRQMTGKFFKRPKNQSGLIPLPGWERRHNSSGFVEMMRLPWEYNPERGYLLQNREEDKEKGEFLFVNLPPSPYGDDRMERIIRGRKKLDPEVAKDLQYDLYSLQAFEIISHLEELIPNSEPGVKLKSWDYRYGSNSQGAVIFENLYRTLLEIIFGRHGSGETSDADDILSYICGNDLFRDHCDIFDRVILSEKSHWFKRASGRDLKRIAIDRALAMAVKPYGKSLFTRFQHILFHGRFSSLLGFGGRRFPLSGSRATIHRGYLSRHSGEEIAIGSAARMIADMGGEGIHANSPGGTSDRPLCKLYKNNMEAWFRGCYRKVL